MGLKVIKYAATNWKVFVHLLLRTRHFGVNNRWWENGYDSLWGLPLYKILWRIVRVYPLIHEYYALKFRIVHNKFLPFEELKLFNWDSTNTPGAFTLLKMNDPWYLFRWLCKRVLKKIGVIE